jgi:3D (Asp-Asp-Asp) domain-containing protein
MCFQKIAILAISCWIGCSFFTSGYASAKERKVQFANAEVTFYYGPVKGQRGYTHGSFRKDVAVNGAGKWTKSGPAPEEKRTLSADKRIFPVGTVIYIPGYGEGVVEDSGKNIKGLRIDYYTGKGDKARLEAEKGGRIKTYVFAYKEED